MRSLRWPRAKLVPAPQVSAIPLSSMFALPETESDVIQLPRLLYTPGTADLAYVGNQGNNSMTVYRHDASGNAARKR